ncbi:MAG: hypothetical protein HXN95_02285 [Prevotella salivae]|jgi:hypothetical protein|uniref:hypothetical protein n=1 Tax=Segatella salivae TaxID=228604 RepID=UPI001CB2549B|nr:hypothetical protein [Segatella salivae]MBF1520843.1 hypothetical protein [Segatella salivae]
MVEKTGIVASVDRFGEGKTFTFAYEVGHIGLRIAANDSVFSVISDCCLRHIALRKVADEVIR